MTYAIARTRAGSRLAAFAALTLSGSAIAQVPSGIGLAVVTCPIFRATDLGCHLIRNRGQLYFIASAPPFMPEQGHKVLVEGYVGNGPDMCGGRVIENVRVSVMPELSPECRETLPAAGFKTPTPPAEAVFAAIDKLGEEVQPPSPPFTKRSFIVPYMFGSDFLGQGFGSPESVVEAAALYATASGGSLLIDAQPGTVRLSNGKFLTEAPHVARQRRESLRAALVALGVPAESIAFASLPPPDATLAARERNVTITVQPGQGFKAGSETMTSPESSSQPRPLAYPPVQVDTLVDRAEIENLQATYMQYIGNGDFDSIAQLFDLDNPEVELSYAGRPKQVGRAAVLGEWRQFKEMYRENGGAIGTHMLTTPVIAVSPDRTSATASWITFGFTFKGPVFGLKERVGMPTLSTYNNRYRRTPAGWRIVKVSWDIIATFGDMTINPDWGWIRNPTASPFPFNPSGRSKQ